MAKVFRAGRELAAVLPKEIAEALDAREGSEIEFHAVKKGIVVATLKGQAGAEQANPAGADAESAAGRGGQAQAGERQAGGQGKPLLSQEESSLLEKLESIRFSERIPEKVDASLSGGEKKVLEGLIKRGFVTVFRKGNYAKTGVYSIPRSYFGIIGQGKRAAGQTAGRVGQAGGQAPAPEISSMEHFETFGFMIVDNELEAKKASFHLEQQIKNGDVLGTRGFDKKFYVAKKIFYEDASAKVRKLLESGAKSISAISAGIRASEPMALTVLEIMNEQGEVIEKKKGLYQLC